MNEYFSCFENKLEHLFSYFEKSELIDFDEFLIELLSQIIVKVNDCIEIYDIFFRNIHLIFLKNKKDINIFFECFFYFSCYGHDWILYSKMEYLKEV